MSRPKKKQIAAEHLLTGHTVKEAAEAAGVARETLSRWRNHDPDFQWMLSEGQRAANQFVADHLISYASLAVDTLADVCRDPGAKGSERISAASAILDRLPPITEQPAPVSPREVLGENYDAVCEYIEQALGDSESNKGLTATTEQPDRSV